MSFTQTVKLDIEPDSLQHVFGKPNLFFTTQELFAHLKQTTDSLQSNGYFSASVDSISQVDQTIVANVYLGEQIEAIRLTNGNLPEELFSEYALQQPTSWEEVRAIKQSVLNHYLTKGYINSEVNLTDFTISDDEISAAIQVQTGNQYKLDSLIVDGDLRLSSTYLNRYFNVRKNDLLTKNVLETVELRATQSNLFTLQSAPRFRFKPGNKADVYLNLAEKRGNQFDLLIGLQPNSNLAREDQSLLVTGEGELELLNPFGGGRELAIYYKQLQPESPILNANVYLPIVFGQRFGARGDFHLEKQDSSFIKLNYSGGINYQFEANKHLTIGVEATNSYLQSVDLDYVLQTGLLPPSSDFEQTLYFGKFVNSTLNSIFAPTKGFRINARAGVGNRTINPEAKVLELQEQTGVNYQLLYDEVNEEKLTSKAEASIEYFIPIKNSAAVLVKNESAYQYLATYFTNDLYRIGGINTVRGFDERSVLASAYSITTAEYRLLLNRDSFFSVFSDAAYVQNEQNSTDNFLIGFGSGLDLSTKAGIFSVNLALGKSNEEPFNFDKTRIHFGYVNVF